MSNPDAFLANIRTAMLEINDRLESDQMDDFHHPVIELVVAVAALDEWMSKGGFPPRDWSVPLGRMDPAMQEQVIADATTRLNEEGL